MKRLKQKCITLFIFLLFLVICQKSIYGQVGITFKFENPVYSNVAGTEYFDFDITAEATENSQFKIAQIYINYNISGFGSSLVTNGKVTITKGALLNDKFDGPFPNFGAGSYSVTVVDNTASTLTIQNDFSYLVYGTYFGKGYELTNTLETVPQVYVHVKMKIFDATEYSGLSFNTLISQWDIQDYYYTTPFTDNQTIYTNVDETSTLDTPIGNPLPVELVSFIAKVKDKSVILNWKTATELNNYGFDIERSSASPGTSWKTIGFVEGNGNSNSPKEYSFTDKDVRSSNYIYRLKQIDNDGRYEYSPNISVVISTPADYTLAQNFPNPFNPSTTIKFSIPESGVVKLTIYNPLGEEIKILVEEQREAGSYTELFEASEMNSGIYFYKLEVNDFIQIKKMILLK